MGKIEHLVVEEASVRASARAAIQGAYNAATALTHLGRLASRVIEVTHDADPDELLAQATELRAAATQAALAVLTLAQRAGQLEHLAEMRIAADPQD